MYTVRFLEILKVNIVTQREKMGLRPNRVEERVQIEVRKVNRTGENVLSLQNF